VGAHSCRTAASSVEHRPGSEALTVPYIERLVALPSSSFRALPGCPQGIVHRRGRLPAVYHLNSRWYT
jgi:hypothetical protein